MPVTLLPITPPRYQADQAEEKSASMPAARLLRWTGWSEACPAVGLPA